MKLAKKQTPEMLRCAETLPVFQYLEKKNLVNFFFMLVLVHTNKFFLGGFGSTTCELGGAIGALRKPQIRLR
jgi:hypothetical protein